MNDSSGNYNASVLERAARQVGLQLERVRRADSGTTCSIQYRLVRTAVSRRRSSRGGADRPAHGQ